MLSRLDRTPAVKHLLIINVIVFLLMNFTPISEFYSTFALQYFDSPNFGIWQLVTHMFLHANMGESLGIMHIFFNMFMLFQFGSVLEHHWGTKKFVIFYFVAGLGGALFFLLNHAGIFTYLLHTAFPVTEGLLNPLYLPSAVGASGAISGIMAAFAFLHPNTRLMLMFIPVPIKAMYLIGAVFLWDLIAGVMDMLSTIGLMEGYRDGIAHFAHLGGAIFGMLLLFYWQKNRNQFY